MKKETLLEIIIGTIGGLVTSIGMCMCLLPKWNLFKTGIIVSIIGVIVLLCIIPIYRRKHPKQRNEPINWGIITTWIIGIVGALVMGFGMSKVMTQSANKVDMIIGMVTGIVGLIICVLNYPIYAFIKNK